MHCFVKQKNPFKTQRGVRSVAMKSFPRTEVAGVSLPRMLMGTNWVYGWSHTGAAADRNIVMEALYKAAKGHCWERPAY